MGFIGLIDRHCRGDEYLGTGQDKKGKGWCGFLPIRWKGRVVEWGWVWES